MSLQPLPLELEEADLPRHVAVLLEETAEDVNSWQSAPGTHPFVPADYVLVWDALRVLRPLMRKESRKPVFLEWGSGMGVVTLMAAALGWDACGIEIQEDLVRESRSFSRQFGLPARFIRGSFFPEDREAPENLESLCARASVVYVYPWPDYEIQTYDLFDRMCGPESVLLAYHGVEDVRAFRKLP